MPEISELEKAMTGLRKMINPENIAKDLDQRLKIRCLELATQAKAASDNDTDTLTKAKSYYEWLDPSAETITKE